MTNCFQLLSLFTTLQTTFAQCVRLFLIFETGTILSKLSQKHVLQIMVPELVRLKNDLETIHSPLLENLMLYFTELYTNNRQVRDIVTLAFPNIHSVSIYKRRERAIAYMEAL